MIGSIAALGLPVRMLNAMAGLGFVFTSRTPEALLTGFVVRALLRFLFMRRDASVLVQNEDDRAAIAALGVPADRVFLISGSGVDADQLTPMQEPQAPMTAGFVGRLLDDKGLRTLVAAHEILAGQGRPVRLLSLSFNGESLETIRKLIDVEAAKGVDLVVLPETWRGQKDDTMETLDGPTINAMAALRGK